MIFLPVTWFFIDRLFVENSPSINDKWFFVDCIGFTLRASIMIINLQDNKASH